MTLWELITCGLIKDEQRICLQVHLTKEEIVSGLSKESWDWKIESFRYEHGDMWTVTVEIDAGTEATLPVVRKGKE